MRGVTFSGVAPALGLFGLLALACKSPADSAATDSASASIATDALAALPNSRSTASTASAPRPNGSAPSLVTAATVSLPAELTTPIPNAVPALKEAVAAFTHQIAEYGGHLGVAILDVGSGELLAAQNDHRPLNPASTAKLFTSAAALSVLRGNYRFETGLYGEAKGGSASKLVLRGHGDPSLATQDLWDVVQDLKGLGVRRVEGDILVDQRFFDDSFVPPAFEQQPNEWAYFRAPVSALALNGNTVRMMVRPTTADAPALVSFDPPGFVDIDGAVKTAAEGTPQSVRLELVPNGSRLSAHVGGVIAEKDHSIGFTRRCDDPNLLPGYAFKALLHSAGIAVEGGVQLGGDAAKALLVMHRSRPLAQLLYELGKDSDNFYAEMILKTLGAEQKGRPGKSTDGAEVVVKYLKEIGAFEEGMIIKNGSGLFDANRVTAAGTVKLLRAAYRDPAISSEFVGQLAIGGVDGTLHKRFRELKDKRILRAKTGTLEATSALSGYVFGAPGKAPLAFAIVVNDVAGKVSGTRAAMDKLIDAVVKHASRSETRPGEARANERRN
ncbi:MAG TPA: D-alanyl-D-alanine carboxypeptidase/D-alanyl-D-alanine-endopeptidase [Polyangiaceae bacterium]|nr:D-alanyl-D-alanine carboxypeptidase/D-alanyl-D-alanine-endopeptidase [Polyangiaceae bacterium]